MVRKLAFLLVGFFFASASVMPIANAAPADKTDTAKPVAAVDNAMKDSKDTAAATSDKNAKKDKKDKKGKGKKGKKGKKDKKADATKESPAAPATTK